MIGLNVVGYIRLVESVSGTVVLIEERSAVTYLTDDLYLNDYGRDVLVADEC